MSAKATVVFLAAGLLLGLQAPAQATIYIPPEAWWVTDGSGLWGDGINWDTGSAPDGAGSIAHLERPTTASAYVNLDADTTVGTLYLQNDSMHRYFVQSTNGSTLRFNNNGGGSNLFLQNVHNFDANTIIEDTLTCRTPRGGNGVIHFGTLTTDASQGLVMDSSGAFVRFKGQATFGAGSEILLNAGSIEFRQMGAIAGPSRVSLKTGATATIDDGMRGSRLSTDLVELCGGKVSLYGFSATGIRNETFGAIGLARGASTLEAYGNPTYTTTMQSGAFTRASGATVAFSSSDAAINPVGAAAYLKNGVLPFATFWGDFATLDQAGTSIVPYAGYYTGDINLAGATDNVKIMNLGMTTLTGPLTINSLNMIGPRTLDLGQNLLSVDSGGLIVNSGVLIVESSQIGGGQLPIPGMALTITGGSLTAGVPAGSQQAELIIHAPTTPSGSDYVIPVSIDANIVNNGKMPVMLTVSGAQSARTTPDPRDGVVYLSGTNTYSGGTAINAITVSVDSDARLGEANAPISLVGGTLEATGTFSLGMRPIAIDGAAAFTVKPYQTLTAEGTVSGAVETLYVRGGGTLALNGTNDFTGEIDVVTVAGASPPSPPSMGPSVALASAVTTLEVSQDANLGNAGNAVALNNGRLRVTGTFVADPKRVFYVDAGGGEFEVAGEQVFTLGANGQLVGADPTGTPTPPPSKLTKSGTGTMVLAAANPGFTVNDVAVTEGTLELQHPQALPSSQITLFEGILSLRREQATEFPNSVVVNGPLSSWINVDRGPGKAIDQVHSINNLTFVPYTCLFVTGGNGYGLAVRGTTQFQGMNWLATQSANVTFAGTLTNVTWQDMLEKVGPGVLNINGPQVYAGSAAIVTEQGTTNFNTDGGSPTARPLYVGAIGSSALVNFNVSQHLGGVYLDGGARAVVTPTTKVSNAIVTNRMEMGGTSSAPTATLDLTNNNLIVDYSWTVSEENPNGISPLVDIANLVKSGANFDPSTGNLQWNGPGITSSIIPTGPDPMLYAVGVREAVDAGSFAMADLTNLEGIPLGSKAVVAKYTWIGDVNLDGKVTQDDYDVMDYYQVFGTSGEPFGAGWWTGDLNGDGVTNQDDYDLADYGQVFQDGSTLGSTTPLGTVPEPATLGLMALGATILLRRKR